MSDERYQLLVESIRDYAILLLDAEGRVQSWNLGAQAIKGWAAAEIIGQHFSVFYTPADRDAGKPALLLAEAAAAGRARDQGLRVRRDGTTFWADVVITALRDAGGALIGFGKVTRDLTEVKKAEQTRLELSQARAALELRDDFLSIASHELKTPLAAMHLTLEGIRRQLKDPAQLQRFETAIDSHRRLVALADSLLDASAMAGGRLVLQRAPCDLADIVAGAALSFRPAAAAQGCTLQVRIAGPVPGMLDPVRLGQVVTNLLGNAAKYAPNTAIDVDLSSFQGQALLTVRDRGPGIPKEDRERVFGRFEHGSGFRDWGGLGLGLYAARQIVEGHGGTIAAHEPEGGGALLAVRLPVNPTT
ncbi:MAG: PAS domain S-box protein [Myxococcaceae bacterium]|nr:PAS domain S-box protein [Myxococcaceae bacterium]